MNVADFIADFRSDLSDAEDPPLWSDAEIVGWLNAAVQEANERAKLTEDSTTAAVCTIPVVAGTAVYPLHPSVFQVKRVALNGRKIEESSVEAQDACGPSGWETRTGTAREYIFQQASGANPAAIRLVRVPPENGTLTLTVFRGALKKLSADLDTQKPELPERFHEHLKNWVYRCACLKADPETLNPLKAAEYAALFEASFGARPDANVQRKQRDKRPPIVRCSW